MSDHVSQLTEELKKKTKLIQSFLLREQHGRIKPPGKEQELHKKVNSIMDTIYAPNSTGKAFTFRGPRWFNFETLPQTVRRAAVESGLFETLTLRYAHAKSNIRYFSTIYVFSLGVGVALVFRTDLILHRPDGPFGGVFQN